MICRVCKIEKETDNFSWSKTGIQRSTRCKECQNTLSKKHYEKCTKKYLERDRASRKKYFDETNIKLYNYLLEHPCVQCNESEPLFLDFDHVVGETKFANISAMTRSRITWEKIEKEIEKCQVLCVKCHRIKTLKEQNAYKYKRYIENYEVQNESTKMQMEGE